MILFWLICGLLHNFQPAYREDLWDATMAGSAHKAWSLEGNSCFISIPLLDLAMFSWETRLVHQTVDCWYLPIFLFNYLWIFFFVQGNVASAISTIQANKITEDTQGMQGLMIRWFERDWDNEIIAWEIRLTIFLYEATCNIYVVFVFSFSSFFN
jgi:hypothetical protein